MSSEAVTMVILAAGVGSRLGRAEPKCLSELPNGESILARQIRLAKKNSINNIIVVCGFKSIMLMEHKPEVLYCYNPLYHITNTSKSLLCALKQVKGDVVWVNGDVVFAEEILQKMAASDGNVVLVDHKKCGEEEVKYRLSTDGCICEISKRLENAQGEALGINRVSGADLLVFIDCLEQCADNDYFERGIELSIEKGVDWRAMEAGELPVIEVDFEEDWDKARELFFDM